MAYYIQVIDRQTKQVLRKSKPLPEKQAQSMVAELNRMSEEAGLNEWAVLCTDNTIEDGN